MADEKSTTGPPPSAGDWDATQWYEVQKGDSLSKIAQKFYGDASLYPKIFEANKDSIKNPNMIRVGQKIRIP
jgi:nucleoid-associated protein YgaU